MFPFHTWLPAVDVEAPTAGQRHPAGVLLNVGSTVLLRFSWASTPLASMTRPGLPPPGDRHHRRGGVPPSDRHQAAGRLLEVSHLGFVVLGLFTLTPQGMVGGIIQMVNHGLSTGALFLMVGTTHERRHTRLIADFGGLWKVIPAFSVLFLIVCLSSSGCRAERLRGASDPARSFQYRLAAVLATSGTTLRRCTCSGCTSGCASAR